MKIIITGCFGNLGKKLVTGLMNSKNEFNLFGLDIYSPQHERVESSNFTFMKQNLLENPPIPTQIDVAGSTIIHFAAVNPFPDATEEESSKSYHMTANLLQQATHLGARRFIFASSNHVMGGYLSSNTEVLRLNAASVPKPGTIWKIGKNVLDSTNYAKAKYKSEELIRKVANNYPEITFIIIRIGWCLPGENKPEDVSGSGTPKVKEQKTSLKTEHWFKGMWLSNRDFIQLIEKSILASSATWDSNYIIINGVSNNLNSVWDLSEAKEYLGYLPKDGIR